MPAFDIAFSAYIPTVSMKGNATRFRKAFSGLVAKDRQAAQDKARKRIAKLLPKGVEYTDLVSPTFLFGEGKGKMPDWMKKALDDAGPEEA